MSKPCLRPTDPVPMAVLNFFPAFTPPSSGGEMRYWHLHSRLARQGFRVRMVNTTFPFVEPETIEHSDSLTEYRIPKTMTHHRLHQIIGRGLGQGECSAAVVALGMKRHREFIDCARRVIRESRVVVFDYPLPLDPIFPRRDGCSPLLVYNAHNIERLLIRSTMKGWSGGLIARWVGGYERNLCRRADLIFACSREDADLIAAVHGVDPSKIYVIPNGVDTAAIRPVDPSAAASARERLNLLPDRPVALFLGSHHPPNIEACRFLIDRVAPALPEVQFLIAGSVCGHLSSRLPNLRLFGKFEDRQKDDLLQAATVAVNPLFSGSGTNLKMLEFFAAAMPVISTPTGARGLMARDGDDLRIADADEFAAILSETISDPRQCAALGQSARELACRSFDWDRIAEDAADIIHHKTHRRVLVLNEFPVSPANFGGRVRICNIYSRLARRANITILTHTTEPHVSRRVLAPGLEEINIPETARRRFWRKTLSRLLGVAADDLVEYRTVRGDRDMRAAFLRESRFAEAVVLCHPFLFPLVREKNPSAVVYDSHDAEGILKPLLYGRSPLALWATRQVRRCESEAIGRARVVGTCSEECGTAFLDLYGDSNGLREKLVVAPNGVDCRTHHPPATAQERAARKRRLGIDPADPLALFLGSGHPPNVEAAEWIIRKLAPECPAILFVLLGGACWPVHLLPRPRNVLLLFQLGEKEKNRLLDTADVALNPLVSGSGTSVKMLDYLAAGSAVVATPVGARGVEVEDGVHGAICEREQMAAALRNMTADPEACHAMGRRGVELARRVYDWDVTCQPLCNAIERLQDENKGI